MRTLFIEAHIKEDITPLLEKIVKTVKDKRIGLVTTVQHIKQLEKAKEYLQKAGKQVFIGTPAKNMTPKQGIYAFHPGQLLGCDASSALDVKEDVDCFVYIGTGEFHPLFVAFNSEKPVWTANPLTKQVELLPEERKRKYLAKQAARMQAAKESKCYGFIVSTKPGQYYLNQAKRLLEQARSLDKEGIILLSDTLTPNDMLNFHQIDCYVNTSCPRIAEDQPFYERPIVNGSELAEIFKELKAKSF